MEDRRLLAVAGFQDGVLPTPDYDGTRGDRVYLADPSRGNIRMPAYRFLDSWLGENGTGIIFVVEPPDGLPDDEFPLRAPTDGLPQPEILTARELLAVGNLFLRLPDLAR